MACREKLATVKYAISPVAQPETRDALRIRTDRAESDLDAARTEHQRLTGQLAGTASADPASTAEALPPAPNRTRKTTATRTPKAES
jgi:hypothetical protein